MKKVARNAKSLGILGGFKPQAVDGALTLAR